MTKNVQKRSKWPKNAQNCQKTLKISEKTLNIFKIAEYGKTVAKNADNCPKSAQYF